MKWNKTILVAATMLLAFYNVYVAKDTKIMSDVAMENVEALATGEALTIGCDEYSVVIVCKRTCLNCYTEYKALNGYGNSTDFKGTCECGKTY